MIKGNALGRVILLVIPIFLFTLRSVTPVPVFADQLTLAGCQTFATTITSGAATIPCTFVNSDIGGATKVTFTETGNLSTGVFGVASSVTDTGGFGDGSGAFSGAFVQVAYVFDGLGVSSGTAQFGLTVNGVLASNIGPNHSNAEFEYVGETGTLNGAPLPPGGTGLTNGTSNIVIDTPISSGTTELTFALVLSTDCTGVEQCTSSADFLDPLTITGANALDANGNPVSGVTFDSESGFNPNGAPVSAPEPSSILCLGAGILALIALKSIA